MTQFQRRGSLLEINSALNRPTTKFGVDHRILGACLFFSIAMFLLTPKILGCLLLPALIAAGAGLTRKDPPMFRSPVIPYILDCLVSSPQSALAKNTDLALIVHDSEHNSFDPQTAAIVPTREAGYACHGTGESIRHPPTPAAVTRSEASINALRRPAIVRIRPVIKGQIKVYSPVRTAAHNSDPAHLQKGGIKPSIRKCVRPNQEFGVAQRASCTVAKSLTNNHINLTHTCR